MRVRDLVEDVEYASCDGRLIVPVKPVGLWHVEPVLGKNGQRTYDKHQRLITTFVPGKNPAGTDPWGLCTGAQKPAEYGVLCDVYNVDRDGKRTETIGRQLYAPGDIKGTWLQYLSLYAEKVRKEADEATEERETKAILDEITASLQALYPALEVRIHVTDWRPHTDYERTVTVSFSDRRGREKTTYRQAVERVADVATVLRE